MIESPTAIDRDRRLARARARRRRARARDDYIADDGFTARVMAALPRAGRAAGVAQARARRAVGVAGGGHRRRAARRRASTSRARRSGSFARKPVLAVPRSAVAGSSRRGVATCDRAPRRRASPATSAIARSLDASRAPPRRGGPPCRARSSRDAPYRATAARRCLLVLQREVDLDRRLSTSSPSASHFQSSSASRTDASNTRGGSADDDATSVTLPFSSIVSARRRGPSEPGADRLARDTSARRRFGHEMPRRIGRLRRRRRRRRRDGGGGAITTARAAASASTAVITGAGGGAGGGMSGGGTYGCERRLHLRRLDDLLRRRRRRRRRRRQLDLLDDRRGERLLDHLDHLLARARSPAPR